MTHGDNHGLVLPPNIAPIKVVFIPIGKDEKVLNIINDITKSLPEDISYQVDTSDKTPGFKFADAEVKGIPIRVEIGMRDLENNQVTLVRRDTLEKIPVDIENVVSKIEELLPEIQQDMYDRALKRRDSMIYDTTDYETFKKDAKEKNGFYKINWCGNTSCEDKIKEDTGLKSRCIIEKEEITGSCIVCGEKATTRLYVGKQY